MKPSVPFSVAGRPVGPRCDLKCSYCYFLAEDLLAPGAGKRMAPLTLDRYVQQALSVQGDQAQLLWHGGEPLLSGLGFMRMAVMAARDHARPGQSVQHVVTTNGRTIDENWARFFADNAFRVEISIDGPAEVHDLHRKDLQGEGTHAEVERGWHTLHDHGVDVTAVCVIGTASEGRGRELYRYFRDELGARRIRFLPLIERVDEELEKLVETDWSAAIDEGLGLQRNGTRVTSRTVSPTGYGQFLISVFDEWYEHDREVVHVELFDTTEAASIGEYTWCVHAPQCGTTPVVDFNGDAFFCDENVTDDFLLGSILDRDLRDLVEAPMPEVTGRIKSTALPSTCRSCEVLWACNGGCPKDRFVSVKNGHLSTNYLCAGLKAFFTHAGDKLRRSPDQTELQPADALANGVENPAEAVAL